MKRLMSYTIVLTLLIAFFAIDLFGQNFTNNTGGTYAVSGTGVGTVRMIASNGKFDGSAPLGASTAIPGTVDWGPGCTTASFTIGGTYSGGSYQPTYYTNLAVSDGGTTQTYQNNVFVAGTYTPTGANRNYGTYTFTYNGTTGNQSVPGENTPGNGTGYNNLTLTGASTKSVAASTTATVSGTYDQDGTSGAVTNNGSVTLNGSGGTNTIASDLTNSSTGTWTFSSTGGANGNTISGVITNDGTLNLGAGATTDSKNVVNGEGSSGKWTFGAGAFTQSGSVSFTNNAGSTAGNGVFLPTGAGTVTLVGFANTTGQFDAVDGTTIDLSGAFTQAGGSITFSCGANFSYTGAAQTILQNGATPSFSQYGNLTFGGTGTITAGGDVNVCKNLTVNQMANFLHTSPDYTLTMLNTGDAGSASYSGLAVELQGNMKWKNQSSGKTYTYNNTNTTIKYETAPGGTYVALDVQPNTAPTQYNNADPSQDVHRRIVATYDGTAGIISDLSLQWYASDETGAGYSSANNNLIRFAEGFSSGSPDQKIVRFGASYDHTNAGSTPRYVMYNGGSSGTSSIALDGAAGGGTVKELSSGSEIILTQAPMDVISVINGRWTNPATWDTGLEPTAADNVHVRTVVWTGIDQAVFSGSAYAVDELDGATGGDGGASANKIYVDNFSNSCLVIGNNDASMATAKSHGEYLFRTRMTNNTTFVENDNTNANTGDGDGTSASGLNGIWVQTTGTSGNYFVPVLGTYTLTNNGSINNRSIISVGVCM